ncbi:hypothetical protein [Brevundimonas sp.]|uniref:hypothetical protein n=1 Tax=Brevundimonas sp. TaxID=1871086 RepID=UPI00391DE31A
MTKTTLWATSLAVLCALGMAPDARAQDRAPLLERLAVCRQVADPASRLTCYDQAAQALDEAERQGEIVIVDSARIEETRRQAFGFNLPSLAGFRRAGGEPDIEGVNTTLAHARSGPDRKWLFTLADGSVWRQIDNGRVLFRNREGVEVRIRRAAVGSYLMSIDGTRGVRVRREQ